MTLKNKYSILILIFFLSIRVYPCTCPIKKLSDLQKAEIRDSECIFIGEVINYNKNNFTYEIKVLESLDGGDIAGNTYIGKNLRYCSPYIDEIGKWIIYAQDENGDLILNKCGISRSFKNCSVNPIPPAPDFFNIYMSQKERDEKLNQFISERQKKEETELTDEINYLRKSNR